MADAGGMYRERGTITRAKDLEQGDILSNLFIPEFATKESFHLRDGVKCLQATGSLADQDPAKLRVLAKLTRCTVMVLSNSCDIFGGRLPVTVAPIRPFKFNEPTLRREVLLVRLAEILGGDANGEAAEALRRDAAAVPCSDRAAVKSILERAIVLAGSANSSAHEATMNAAMKEYEVSDAEQWRQVNDAATGTTTTKSFYLAGRTSGSHGRSLAHLAEAYPLTHSYLDRCITESGAVATCGLTPEAQRHLQWAIGMMFSRDARDDEAWPSREDFELQRAWLIREIERGGARHEENKAALARVERLLRGATSSENGRKFEG